MRNFQLEKMMGFWNVVQYYSSTEETGEYKCMSGELEIINAKEVSINTRQWTSYFTHLSFQYSPVNSLTVYLNYVVHSQISFAKKGK